MALSPVGMWDRPQRSGYTRCWCGATNSRGPPHYRGTSHHASAPRIGRKGFLRRTGLLQLLKKNRNKQIIPKTLHQVALTAQTC